MQIDAVTPTDGVSKTLTDVAASDSADDNARPPAAPGQGLTDDVVGWVNDRIRGLADYPLLDEWRFGVVLALIGASAALAVKSRGLPKRRAHEKLDDLMREFAALLTNMLRHESQASNVDAGSVEREQLVRLANAAIEWIREDGRYLDEATSSAADALVSHILQQTQAPSTLKLSQLLARLEMSALRDSDEANSKAISSVFAALRSLVGFRA